MISADREYTKFENGEGSESINFNEDLLDDDSDIVPPRQMYYVMGFVEPSPEKERLRAIYEWNLFVRYTQKNAEKNGHESIIDRYLKESQTKRYGIDYLLNYFNMFIDKYPLYGGYRIMKFFGAYSSMKRASKQAKDVKERGANYTIQINPSGYWVMFNTPDKYIKNVDYGEDKMQQLMSQHMNNNVKASEHFNRRRKLIIAKEKAKKTITKAFESDNVAPDGTHTRIEDDDSREFTPEELEHQFAYFDPEKEFSTQMDDGDRGDSAAGKQAKALIKTELMAGSALINVDMITALNMDQKWHDILKKNKIIVELNAGSTTVSPDTITTLNMDAKWMLKLQDNIANK